MIPSENALTGPSLNSQLETSPETLQMLQQIDFSSFAESDDPEASVKIIEMESDDPFDSDDLEGLVLPSSFKFSYSQSPQKTTYECASVTGVAGVTGVTKEQTQAATTPFVYAGVPQQAQKQPHEMKIKVESQKSCSESESVVVCSDKSGEPESLSSPEFYSCTSEVDGVLKASNTPQLRQDGAFKVKEEANSFQVNSQNSQNLEHSTQYSSVDVVEKIYVKGVCKRPLSVQSPSCSPQKRAHFSSPQTFQSYASQMQYRDFSTNAAELPQVETVKTSHTSIQLATQKKDLNLPQTNVSSRNPQLINDGAKTVTPFILSREQDYVLQLAKQGKSIFFTGSAGTGKSILLKSIISELRKIRTPGSVAVTASTGLAACNVGGCTLHSFAGIGLGKGPLNTLIRTVKRNRKVVNRWKETEVLIIDEISMISGKLFEHLDHIARAIRRRHNSPFGGIQVIVCGDFYQLPPVNKAEMLPDGSEKLNESVFAFQSTAWDTALDHSIVLKEVFRQKGDQEFIEMLNDMRHGIVSPTALTEFIRLSRPLVCPANIVPTELYATRNEVDRANTFKLKSIKGAPKVYVAKDGGSLPIEVRKKWLENFLAPQDLVLKEQAQVMCIKNIDDTLVNGSLGTIIRFVDRTSYMCETIQRENPQLDLGSFMEKCKKEKDKKDIRVDSVFNFMAKKYLIPEQPANESQSEQKEVKSEDSHSGQVKSEVSPPDNVKIEQSEPDHVKIEQSQPAQVKSEQSQPAQAKCEESQSEADTTDPDHDPFKNSEDFVSIKSQNIERKLNFIKALDESSTKEKLPLVRFLCPDGVTMRDHLMEPERWEICDDKTDEVLVYRIQYPLMLAWALSIHKSQGQTLQKVKVDLSRIFENGQAYVALSRAVSRDGLQVINFREDRVRAHPTVDEFYNSLSSTEDLSGGKLEER